MLTKIPYDECALIFEVLSYSGCHLLPLSTFEVRKRGVILLLL